MVIRVEAEDTCSSSQLLTPGQDIVVEVLRQGPDDHLLTFLVEFDTLARTIGINVFRTFPGRFPGHFPSPPLTVETFAGPGPARQR